VAKKAVTIIVDEKVIFTDLLKDNVQDIMADADPAIEKIEYLKKKIVKKVFPKFDRMYHPITRLWKCRESHGRYRGYDVVEDQAHEDGISCNEPEERK